MELPVHQSWYKDGLQFECTGCGNCCTGGPGYVWISDAEIDRLAEFLKLTPLDVRKQYCRKFHGEVGLKEKVPNARGEYDCIFLKEVPAEPGDGTTAPRSKRICTVYPVRPLQCRTWPFWSGTLASKEAWQKAGDRCPGVNRGKRWTVKEIAARRDATEWPK
jgi:uncharacterized protein